MLVVDLIKEIIYSHFYASLLEWDRRPTTQRGR
jgi:hypothetical protein